MTWEILAIGNGDLLWQIFNGVKLLTQGPWFSLMQVVALLAILAGLTIAAVKPDSSMHQVLLLPILTILIIALVSSGIKVNVAITDVLNPTTRQEVLTDVPIGVALPWWIQSQFSYELTSLVNGAFSASGKPTVFEGFMKHQLELQALMTAQLPVGDARQTMISFLSECVFLNMIGDGRILSPNQLRDSRDLLGAIGVNMVDRVRASNMFVDGNIAANRLCQDAFFNNDDGILGVRAIFGADNNGADGAHPDYQKVLHRLMLVTGTSDYNALETELETMFVGLTGVPLQTWTSEFGSSAQIRVPLNTVLIRDVWESAVVVALEADQNVAGVTRLMISSLRRELQYQTFSQSWTLSQWVPMMRSLAECLVLIMAPFGLIIMMANARLFGVGAFVKMFLWLALWWPLLALLDATMYFYAARELRMAMLCPNGAPDSLFNWIQQAMTTLGSNAIACQGITLRNYDQIKTIILSINAVGNNLIASVPVLAGAIVYTGGNLAGSVAERVAQSAPDSGGVSKSAGAGKLDAVGYEGGGRMITWSQETGLTSTADYMRGVKATHRSDGSSVYSGLEGNYTTDRFGNVIAGSRVRQTEDGSTVETTGNGNVQRVTTTRMRADGTSEQVVQTYNTAGGQRQLFSTDTFTRSAEGLTVRGEFNADGKGTIQETGVDRATGHVIERKLNQDRSGSESRSGQAWVPVLQEDGSTRSVLMDGEIRSRYDNGTTTPITATFRMNDEKGTHLRHARWNAEKGAFEFMAGQSARAITDTRAAIDPTTGKPAFQEMVLAPDGTVVSRTYRSGASSQNDSFEADIDGEHLRGRASTFIANDGTQIKLFDGTVQGADGQVRRATGLISSDAEGRSKFVQRDDLAGIAGEDRAFKGKVDNFELEGSRRWQSVGGRLIETFSGLVDGRQGHGMFVRDRHGTERFVRLEAKGGLNIQQEDVNNTVRERLNINREKNVKDTVSENIAPHEWTDDEGKTHRGFSRVVTDAAGNVLTSELTDLQSQKVWQAFQDPKTGTSHYGVADRVMTSGGAYRILKFQEIGQAEIERNGFATSMKLLWDIDEKKKKNEKKELFSRSEKGQEVRDAFTYSLDRRVEAAVSAASGFLKEETNDLTKGDPLAITGYDVSRDKTLLYAAYLDKGIEITQKFADVVNELIGAGKIGNAAKKANSFMKRKFGGGSGGSAGGSNPLRGGGGGGGSVGGPKRGGGGGPREHLMSPEPADPGRTAMIERAHVEGHPDVTFRAYRRRRSAPAQQQTPPEGPSPGRRASVPRDSVQ
ncbi:MAG: conjugal transfer protein TraG N-terminal domain-containing protein [Nitrospirota bacterium]